MNNIIKCIAIDDEPLALLVISKFCERHGNMELVTYSDPLEGFAAMKEQKFDLLFLDIEMEGLNGLAIASELPEDMCFIFTTAYLHYAVDGFNLDAVDYLHKPFSYERFVKAVERALKRIDYNKHSLLRRCIVVKQEYNNISIPLSEIVYIEAMEGYSKIFRTDGKCTISRVILKVIGAMLPDDDFVRIHRSYIVAKDKIESYTRQNVRLVNGVTLPIGRQYGINFQNPQ